MDPGLDGTSGTLFGEPAELDEGIFLWVSITGGDACLPGTGGRGF